MKPRYCPLCASDKLVARHMIGSVWEVMCESCGKPCVISVNDQQKQR